jgi:acetyltransferase-like isoleucine patch superfamily enzyme
LIPYYKHKGVEKKSFIDKTVQVNGWKNVSIGHHTIIGADTWINVNNRIKNQFHIIIGNNCCIARRNFFSSGAIISIGDYCLTGPDCKFLGSDHIFDNPMVPYIVSGTTDDKSIVLKTNVWLGGNVLIIGNVTIGHGSVIGAGALVTKDIPPFSIAIGNPCKIIKRYDFNSKKWLNINEIKNESDLGHPTDEEYINLLKNSYPGLSIPLEAVTKAFGDLL